MSPADLLRQQLAAAQARCERFLAIRRKLPANANRARRLTAHSRWFRACEERDRLLVELELDPGAYVEQLAIAEVQRGA